MGNVSGLTEGLHGFHTHDLAKADDIDTTCEGVGPHFNPDGQEHGDPNTQLFKDKHRGAHGNISADDDENAGVHLEVPGVSLNKDDKDSILGKAIVVHANKDDLAIPDKDGNF